MTNPKAVLVAACLSWVACTPAVIPAISVPDGGGAPCLTVTCGTGQCAVVNESTAICVCEAGSFADGLSCKPIMPGAECDGVTCDNRGTCVVLAGTPNTPRCQCDGQSTSAGPTTCVARVDPCAQVTCNGKGTCAVSAGAAVCVCDAGYRTNGAACEAVVPGQECLNVDCSGHGTCGVANGSPLCSCDPGFDRLGTTCVARPAADGGVDVCANVTCSGHGQCARLGNGAPVCVCNPGYFANGTTCLAVIGCDNVDCNVGGSCAVVNNAPACTCGPGYTSAGATTCLEMAAPFIRRQPASTSVALGQAATFSVTASGQATLSYQWRKNGTAIAGATARSYTTPATVVGDNAAEFSVVVSNSVGTATSNNATLTVATAGAPVFTTQPRDLTVTSPATASFEYAATGATNARWQDSLDGTTWNMLPVFNTPVFTTSPTSAADNGRLYRVIAFNAAAPLGVTSDVATLTVLTAATEAPTFTTPPADTLALTPATATFTVVVTGRPRPTLQWQESANGTTWTDLPGATAATYTTPASTAALHGRSYRAIASNPVGQAISAPASLEVRLAGGAPTVTVITQLIRHIPFGNSAVFEVVASGAGTLTYQWKRVGGAGGNVTNSARTQGATTSRLQIEGGSGGYTLAATLSNPLRFEVVVTNAFGSATSSTVSLSTYDEANLPGQVTTLAGNGTPGSVDGTGAAARFTQPGAMASDAAGNLYLVDPGNYTIRKITPTGVVTTVAGLAGTAGNVNGPVATATFDNLRGIAVTPDGATIYVSQDGATIDQVRKIAGGMVTAFAGGFVGAADGTGTAASFNGPWPLALDAAGNLYVGETGNHTIRKVTPAGVVTTLAGLAGSQAYIDGTGAGARFREPRGLAVDAAGTIYVVDLGDPPPGSIMRRPAYLRRITPAGVVTTMAGGGDDASSSGRNGVPGGFSNPGSVALDASGNVYVGETSTLRKVSSTGVVSTVCGDFGTRAFLDGAAAVASFNTMAGLAVGAGGVVSIADGGNFRVRKFAP